MPVASELLTAAEKHHQAGHAAQAIDVCRQILTADPRNADALALSAAAHTDLGQFGIAAAEVEQALAINPQHGRAHDSRGLVFARQGRLAEAAESFERAAAHSPGRVSPLFNLATARFQSGQYDRAIQALEQVLRIDPNSIRAHTAVAVAMAKQNRLADATPHLREVARLKPGDAPAHFELAGSLFAGGRLKEAEASYRECLRLKPDWLECITSLAGVLVQRTNYAEAITLCERVLAVKPDYFEAQFSLGMSRLKQEDYARAEAALAEAARLKPDSAEALVNLGIALANLTRYDESEAAFHRALALGYLDGEALHNLGLTLVQLRRLDEAQRTIEKALELQPDNADTHYNLSTVLFFRGRLREAFVEYEWRFKTRQSGELHLRWPAWDGSPIEGRTIVLCGEQGFGDTFQFIRYAQVLKQRGARVFVQCMDRLHPIVSRAAGVDHCLAPTADPPPADCCVALMSVAHRLGTDLDTIPNQVPYLFADPALVDLWKTELARHEGFRVGLVWQGNPSIGGDRNRSIPLVNYAPLSQVPGVRLINLQKGPGYDQLAGVQDAWGVVDFGKALDAEAGAFMDTAAIMRNLDLVISSDTSAAHLAGGLGVPVWLALEYMPDWRWLLDREDCPWYPTMRVFRQTKRGDWPGVFGRMAAALVPLAAAKRPR